jgi:hypothetical protein
LRTRCSNKSVEVEWAQLKGGNGKKENGGLLFRHISYPPEARELTQAPRQRRHFNIPYLFHEAYEREECFDRDCVRAQGSTT